MNNPLVSRRAALQPLVSCLRHLQTKGGAVKLQLCDTWLREFQVRLLAFFEVVFLVR